MNEKQLPCSKCKYGEFFRIAKNEHHIPTHEEYMCIDRSKKREIPEEFRELMEEAKKSPFRYTGPSPFDYSNGPGGWDGETCPNFVSNDGKNLL